VTPLSWNLDHVGAFARSVEDAALALEVLAGYDEADALSSRQATSDYVPGTSDARPPRLGIPRWLYADKASAEVSAHLEEVASRFLREGAGVDDVPAPPSAATLHDAHALIMRVDAAAYHRESFQQHADSYRPFIRKIVEEGLAVPGFEYARARRLQREFRRDLARAVAGLDALLLPVAPTTAPKGLQSTGDPRLCVPGSLSGLPAIAIPSGVSGEGLPLAIQLLGGPFGEATLLATASWCERVLAFRGTPDVPPTGP
jgi:Asp-tRNA(Asn)/Glu-tRNA(Gln) amidotransferase A subunit family amidase